MILRTVCKDHVPGKLDPALLKALPRGRRWFEEMASDRVRSCAEIARREGLQKGYLARLMRLAFVAPRIVDAVAAVACRPVLPCKWSVSADRRPRSR